jgi:hypothetical protein
VLHEESQRALLRRWEEQEAAAQRRANERRARDTPHPGPTARDPAQLDANMNATLAEELLERMTGGFATFIDGTTRAPPRIPVVTDPVPVFIIEYLGQSGSDRMTAGYKSAMKRYLGLVPPTKPSTSAIGTEETAAVPESSIGTTEPVTASQPSTGTSRGPPNDTNAAANGTTHLATGNTSIHSEEPASRRDLPGHPQSELI